ncbi:short chain alcohol dehydrogenase [Aspergillus bombycis]|uniref:Short chain alcohol dehydrogenase n=1 Tax=Aspergillus bombycis TaxID=109264 RepID=A0A1F8AE04_9EURO|nr:short chain alcohol dehydrogenase [Aspergillus bombycis]OGM49944.1 short chain alcohol dehydrogenase [Aspergillus bombycis]
MHAGRAYIVTGGSSGMGLAVVKKLLGLSATVHAIDKAGQMPAIDSERLHFHPNIDISSHEKVAQTFQSIIQESPVISGLVNCAGILLPSSILEPVENFNKVMAVNVGGTWNVGTAYLRYVLEQHPDTLSRAKEGPVPEEIGSLVNIGSTAALFGAPGIASYCASKHAVLVLTRTWAKDFGDKGVRVNCVAPGGTDTPLLAGAPPAFVDNYVKNVPLRRLARPEEIANTVAFLLSDDASYINGQVIPVEGGFH